MENESAAEAQQRIENAKYLYIDALVSSLGTASEELFLDEINKLPREDLLEGVRRLNKKLHEFHSELNHILIERAAALFKLHHTYNDHTL